MLVKMNSMSKAKLKRLNKKARFERIKSDLENERKIRLSAEKAAFNWKEKALSYKKHFDSDQRAKLTQLATRKCSLQRSLSQLVSASSSRPTFTPVAKATPSVAEACQHLSAAPLIPENHLTPIGVPLGNGSFGQCTKMLYKEMFTVCVKKISADISWSAVKSEAAVLYALNSCDITPHCFGVCLSLHSIVMAYINIGDQPVTLYTLLQKKIPNITLSSEQCTNILTGVCKGLVYTQAEVFT